MGSRAAPLAPERRQIKAVIAALCTQRARGRFVCALRVRLETGLQAYRARLLGFGKHSGRTRNCFSPRRCLAHGVGRLVIKKKEMRKNGKREKSEGERSLSDYTSKFIPFAQIKFVPSTSRVRVPPARPLQSEQDERH